MSAGPNLVLIGFMASGKSTVGRECARRLGFRFADSDAVVVRRAGRSVETIFREDGEAVFRDIETAAIAHLCARRRLVLATGGGAILRPENVDALRASGVVVLLDVTPDVVLLRAGCRTSRPLLADADDPLARVEQLLTARTPSYRAASDAVVETGRASVSEVASRVLVEYRRVAAGRFKAEGLEDAT
jgi:shikimate kinase